MTEKTEEGTKRFSFLLTDDEKLSWKSFIEKNNISTISKLLRESADFYLNNYSTLEFFRNFSKSIHGLKGPLTNIEVICQILLKEKKSEIKWENLSLIKDIFDQVEILQERIININKLDTKDGADFDVLIVDDDPLINKILSKFFEDNGYRCKKAINGTETLEILKNSHPKLILLDIVLPDISGYEICNKIKSNQDLKNIPVYYITAVSASEVEEQSKNTGADGYILKPFKFDKIEQLFSMIS